MLQKAVVAYTKAIEARLLSDLKQLGITGLILIEVVVVLPVHHNFLRARIWTLNRSVHIEITRVLVHGGFLLLLLPALVDLGAEECPTHCCAIVTSYQLAVCLIDRVHLVHLLL